MDIAMWKVQVSSLSSHPPCCCPILILYPFSITSVAHNPSYEQWLIGMGSGYLMSLWR